MEVITTHHNSDFDSLASMIVAMRLYPEAVPVFPGSQEKPLREFLQNNNFFRFETKPAKAIDLDAVKRLIIVDTRQPDRIGRFAELVSKPDVEVHIYDHHPPMPGDIVGAIDVNRMVGATTTVMVKLLQDRKIEITSEEATVIMMGLYEETGSFGFISTTEEDFQAAAYLLSKGANINLVTDYIVKEITPDQLTLLNEMLQAMEKINIGGVDITITHLIADEYKGDLAGLAHRLRDMEAIDVLFVLASVENRIYLISRSRVEEVDAGAISAEFGGGGHHEAASASFRGMSLNEAKEKLISILREKVRVRKSAGDIMSSPVKTIQPTDTIADAGEMMARYGISTLPVVDDSTILGLITREAVERARYHGLTDAGVMDYMNDDIESLPSDAPLSKVREVMIEHNQRAVPIVSDNRLAGIISKTDILRLLHYETLKSPLEPYPHLRSKKIENMMRNRLPQRVLEILAEAGEVADSLGYNLYAVGGFVRDIILGRENLDMDVVVEGNGIEFANLLAERYGCRVKSHDKFGTAVVTFPDGYKVDVATARLEYYERPAVLPTVEKGSIRHDLSRRDFTVNTLAVRLNISSFGELLDYYGAQRDIKEKVIRVLHNMSFVEDPTRVFRAVRFEQRFSFVMSRHTKALIANAVKLNFFDKLSGKRLYNELVLILKEKGPAKALSRMSELGLLRFLHPKLGFGEKERELMESINSSLAWYGLLFLKERCEPWLVYLMGFLDALSSRELEEFCIRLAVPGRVGEKLILSRREGGTALKRLAGGGLSDRELYHLLSSMPTESLLLIVAKGGEIVKKEVSHYMTHLIDIKTDLSGDDLIMVFGLKPGPEFKELLAGLLEARLDGLVKTREDEMEWIKERLVN